MAIEVNSQKSLKEQLQELGVANTQKSSELLFNFGVPDNAEPLLETFRILAGRKESGANTESLITQYKEFKMGGDEETLREAFGQECVSAIMDESSYMFWLDSMAKIVVDLVEGNKIVMDTTAPIHKVWQQFEIENGSVEIIEER